MTISLAGLGDSARREINELESEMNDEQIEQVRELIQEFAEKSSTDFDAAFERVLGVARYHAINVVPWGREAAADSGGVEKR